WRKCSSCKSEIPYKNKYYVCSVSTCNGKRTGLVFCSIPCFERHLPGARHKDAYAVEEVAPASNNSHPQTPQSPQRRIIPAATHEKSVSSTKNLPNEILVVVSKLKNYISSAAGMNTSAGCNEVLSDIIRKECDKAIEKARQAGRKTVLDRDFK
ncbi:MAG: hypothetical protein KDD40_01325, partial [Bdellovibrionales bacterium]|nr:hypothetical protein [Bdellovibrionales bacterium]